MGYDYYRCIFLCVLYYDTDGILKKDFFEWGRVGGYFFDYDSDFMTETEYFEQERTYFPDVDLYKDEKWLCCENSANEYMKIVKDIPNFRTLKRLFKHTSFAPR
jgi:hypothetical protein